MKAVVAGDFGAAAVLISFGVLLGKLNAFQLIFMAIWELFFYTLNEHIGIAEIQVTDIGGSMIIHLFGAVFGLAVSFTYKPK